MKSLHISKAGLLLCLSLVLCSCGTPEPSRPALRGDGSVGHGGAADPTIEFKNLRITRENYHGWSNAIAIRNDRAEVVIVPDIGRVMSFGMVNGENVLWNDPALHGKPVNPEAPEWINFGGDKSWPAPEAEWGLYTGRKNWRPPPAFDSAPNDARVEGKDVVLLSPVDPFYGIQVRRRVHLDSKEPKLTITTTYERVSGTPSKIGVWVITQMRDPVAVFIPGPERSIFPDGFYKFGNEPWTNVVASRGLIHVTRDPAKPHKLGSDADQLLWMGAQIMCLVESPRVRGAEYPDRNASAEVYTNPDPKKYVELEMLGPLSLMKPGDKISQENTYTLFPRTSANPHDEARRIFKR